jgi:hypothetical protein
VEVIQKGYGELKLVDGGEAVEGEITLHAEGWIAVVPVPPAEGREARWFPIHRVAELVWRKQIAMRPPGR